ncbi:MAG TPA: hypothetical protein DCL61_07115 [Cyanobacteria bacterium UBA12227]|nr:hypothetical protein [Cyanobacteria bacterium UBA12227]HAX89811.1 hypothetical protein [Cyanobacteria bacterium UBA11370]HBY78087.1 hypothetical protein [Cyanobacteria bacterium UBA11148]
MSRIDRQREHQANERTFLAWLRTAIALIGFGFAIARFGLFLRQLEATVANQTSPTSSFINSQTLGFGLLIVGILIIILSLWRYNQVFWQIERGDYRPSRLMVWLTAGIAILLGILTIPFLLWRQELNPKTPASRNSRVEYQLRTLLSQLANNKPPLK